MRVLGLLLVLLCLVPAGAGAVCESGHGCGCDPAPGSEGPTAPAVGGECCCRVAPEPTPREAEPSVAPCAGSTPVASTVPSFAARVDVASVEPRRALSLARAEGGPKRLDLRRLGCVLTL